ncbi:MAG: SURF1 family protein [Pseudohongiella sp.]|nr:SURF1 family protein [Pseudohongiella sp.]
MDIAGIRSRTIRLRTLTISFHPLVFICLCSSLGMFISLGFWQLDRADEKRALAMAMQQRAVAEPVALSALHSLAESVADSVANTTQPDTAQSPDQTPGNMTRVQLFGEYQHDISFLVAFQFFQGRAGYELVTPLRPTDGGPLVLVSRGWMSAGADLGRPAVPAGVSGEQALIAQIHVPEFDVPAGEVTDTDWPVRLPRMNVKQAEQLLGEPVYPYVLRLEADQAGVLSRHWSMPRVETRGHFAYAIQWFGIALLVSIAALFYSSNLAQLIKD